MFTHRVVLAFVDGTSKTIDTYCPESWTLEACRKNQLIKKPIASVTCRLLTAKETQQ